MRHRHRRRPARPRPARRRPLTRRRRGAVAVGRSARRRVRRASGSRRWRCRLGRLHRAPARAREERQRAQGADLPHQGPAQPAQGDGARRRHRRVARGHPSQERDGQLVPADQGGVRARRRADLPPRATPALADLQEFDVYNGAIQPGSHTLSVALHVPGQRLRRVQLPQGLQVQRRSRATPSWRANRRRTNITVVGYEKGNITTQLSDKPAIDFRVNVMSAGESGTAAAAKK